MIVLDTNVVSELITPRADQRVLHRIFQLPAERTYLTATTLGELHFGIATMPDGRRRRDLASRLRRLLDGDFAERVLPFPAIAAEAYGVICARRRSIGRPVQVADAQIAAVCFVYGATLVTRNTRDFAGTGIGLMDPWTV